MKKLIASAAAGLLIAGGALVAIASPANAHTGVEVCTPSDAIPGYWEDVPDITHPAVYETVVVTPATEGTPAIWANFSPNEQTGTFVGPPSWPTDERGTWRLKGDIPGGHVGPDGVYANGNPDKGGNWFYRQAAVPATPEVTEQRLVTAEWTEVTPDIWHEGTPAVECPPTPTPTPTPTPAFQAYQERARWLLPASWDYATTPTYQEAIFPQDALTGDLPCGRWSQDDTYWIDSEADAALFASLDDDGVLTKDEDAAIYQSHTFTKGPECAVIPPKPKPTTQRDSVVVEGGWSTPEITCDSEVGDEQILTRTVTTTPRSRTTGEPTYDAQTNTWTQGAFGEWVDGETVVRDEQMTYTVTVEDIAELECVPPTPTPAATPEPSATPSATPVPAGSKLAVTGGETVGLLTAGALAVALLGLGTVLTLKRRRG